MINSFGILNSDWSRASRDSSVSFHWSFFTILEPGGHLPYQAVNLSTPSGDLGIATASSAGS